VAANPPLVSVVIPTRDEADNIGPLVARLRTALGGVSHELCFVDDSDDGTAERIAALAEDGSVRCLHRDGAERAGGLSTAVVTGLRLARGTWVCVIDADLQHPPETIPLLLAEGEAGADLVVASRYVRGGDRSGLGSRGRRLVSRCATLVARLLFREARASSDPLSGFFLCRRSLIDGIEFRPVGFKILLELLVCVPGLRVRDVAVRQEARAAGQSKATLNQGLLYAGHLRSLFLDVPGSARRWKFGLVGASGLAVFLPLLWALAGRLDPVLAFLPAFAVSVTWNGILNWRWTFADQRAELRGIRRYVDWALLSGSLMFAVYALLITDLHWAVLAAGVTAAAAAMVANAAFNRQTVAERPSVWAQVATDHGVQAGLARLAAEIGADRAFVLPPHAEQPAGVPAGLVAYVVQQRKPLLLTEAASFRAQRRSNIEAQSRMLLPVVGERRVVAVVVCERRAPRGFETAALETATRAVADLVPLIEGGAVVAPQARRLSRSAPRPAR
jgi:dolichol-phosphate mannosyltransferase